MKILLVRPIDKNALEISPDLGLGYLATALRKNNHEIKILDCPREGITFKQFENYIKLNNFDIIGFKLFDVDLDSAKKSIKIIKKIKPSTIIIIGGPLPSGSPEIITKLDTDYAFKGEAERSLPLLLENLHNSGFFKNIPGLIWKNKNQIIVNPPIFIKNLDELGFPAWDLIDPNKYKFTSHGIFTKKVLVAPIITTRGCPFQCTFCASKIISGTGLRFRTAGHVLEEIELLYNKYGIRDIAILDDNFTFNKQYVTDICNEIIKRKLNINWSCPNGVRLDTLDSKLLKLMERAGCYSFTVGVESGSSRILTHMKKHINKKTIKEKIDLIRKITNIKITGSFIIGYPNETKEDIIKTIKFSKELKLHRAWFGLFSPFPATEIYNQLKKENKLLELDPNTFYGDRISYTPPGLTYKDLQKFHKNAFLSFYLRPKILLDVLSEIKNFKQIKTLFKRSLSVLRVK